MTEEEFSKKEFLLLLKFPALMNRPYEIKLQYKNEVVKIYNCRARGCDHKYPCLKCKKILRKTPITVHLVKELRMGNFKESAFCLNCIDITKLKPIELNK